MLGLLLGKTWPLFPVFNQFLEVNILIFTVYQCHFSYFTWPAKCLNTPSHPLLLHIIIIIIIIIIIKGIVDSKMKILSSFTHPDVIPKLYDHKIFWRMLVTFFNSNNKTKVSHTVLEQHKAQ